MLPPCQQLGPAGPLTSLSLAPSDPCGSPHEPGSNFEEVHESSSESASSRETWPAETNRCGGDIVVKLERKIEGDINCLEQSVIHGVSSTNKLSLPAIAREKVEIISAEMLNQPEELLEDLKSELRVILEGIGGSQNREEFLVLQKLVQSRTDLTDRSLIKAHRIQLEILVAINTGIQAFLHPNINLSQTYLIEVFMYRRCRNIACQNPLPADGCSCEICTSRHGFCNLCMCVICNKFDFEVNTCRWIGCDMCSHWTHTDCAIQVGQISTGSCGKSGVGPAEMLFKCQACCITSELLGWVKDVFQDCAPGWDRASLMRELDFVSRIFHSSKDPRGRKLFLTCKDLLEKMKNGVAELTACKVMLLFFQELEVPSLKNSENEEGKCPITPQEACSQIAEVVQEAVRKMEMVAGEKTRMFKKARQSLKACNLEFENKTKEVLELQMERQRKKQQIDELESIVRLKSAEADMFQMKADEARREAERLKKIALAKSEKAEEEFASRYLKLRLSEAEAEKQYLFEKMKLHESSRALPGSSDGVPTLHGWGDAL